MYLINEVSRKVNLSQKRIREYEKEGFIRPQRHPHTNNRLYTDFEIQQIERIYELIHDRGFTLAGLKNLLVLAPCWNVFDCKVRESCPAYGNPHVPCWETRRVIDTLCEGPCERCAVYLNRDFRKEYVLRQNDETRFITGRKQTP